MNLSDCFRHFGAKGRNARWSWSARSEDGRVVVITLWKDRVSVVDGNVIYNDVDVDTSAWVHRPGNRERLENLCWARDNCDGFFRAVVVVAENIKAQPRRIVQCYPQPNWNMRILDLNEGTGGFRAVHIR